MAKDNEPRYPDIEVKLIGENSNAYFIIGRVAEALRQGGVETEDIAEFYKEVTNSDYDNLLFTVMEWVSVL